MKIALLIQGASSRAAGIYEVVRAHAHHLIELGANVRIFGFVDKLSPPVPEPFGPGVIVSAFRTVGPTQWGLTRHLCPELIRWRPDIIHTHGIWSGLSISSLIAAKRTEAALVISPHGMLDAWALRNAGLKKKLVAALYERRHLASASLIHALGESEAESVRQWGLENPIAIIPNGVSSSPEAIQAPPPWPADGLNTLLFMGRLNKKKGIFGLIEAWASVESQLPGWCLRIAGWGVSENEQRVRDMLKPLKRAQFLGRQAGPTKDACYQNAHGFILPSFSEGLPMAVLEAWSSAVPVLMTRECNLSDAFFRNAAIKIDTDVPALASALVNFARMNAQDRLALGERGRALCEERYQWPQIVNDLHNRYQQTLALRRFD